MCRAAQEFRGIALLPEGGIDFVHYQRKVETPDANGRLKDVVKNGERCWYFAEKRGLMGVYWGS
jgi:hypothetical protein